jgi:hydroxymethylpyrimidine pyrophosphatase-like HAD family hydrolase
MLIALDWDDTYTANKPLWNDFIQMCIDRGVKVIIVTGRPDHENHRVATPFNLPVVYAGNELKEKAALRDGYKVNIWIDDMPGMIQNVKILDFGEQS